MKTIEEVLRLFPDTKAEQWKQHEDGKGWVFEKSYADKSAYIEGIVSGKAQVYGNALVYDNARVSGKAQVYGNALVYGDALVYGNALVYGDALVSDNARVYGDALVYGNALVYDNAQVYDNARVSGKAQVYGNALVYGDALVYDNALVYGDAWDKSPLYIQGTKHSLTLCSHTEIAIGCHVLSVEEWLKRYQAIGKKEGYSAQEIEEYGEYIQLFAATSKRLAKRKATESGADNEQ